MSKTPDHDFEFDGMFSLPPSKTPDHDAEFSMERREDALQVADVEFEAEVGGQVGPIAAPAVDASVAHVKLPTVEQFPLLGAYYKPDEDLPAGTEMDMATVLGMDAAHWCLVFGYKYFWRRDFIRQ